MTDPFALIAQAAQMQEQAANRDSQMAQNALMQMFQDEAQRQLPYATMPIEAAMGQQKLQNSLALAAAKSKMRRYKKNKSSNADTPAVRYNDDGTVATDNADQ